MISGNKAQIPGPQMTEIQPQSKFQLDRNWQSVNWQSGTSRVWWAGSQEVEPGLPGLRWSSFASKSSPFPLFKCGDGLSWSRDLPDQDQLPTALLASRPTARLKSWQALRGQVQTNDHTDPKTCKVSWSFFLIHRNLSRDVWQCRYVSMFSCRRKIMVFWAKFVDMARTNWNF